MLKSKKFWIISIIIILVIGGLFWYFKNKKEQPVYTTETARKGTLVQTVSVTGTLKSEDQVDLNFEVSGILRDVKVKVGDRVKKGQLLAVLDPRTYYGDLKSAEEDVKIQEETVDLHRRKWDDFKPEEKETFKATVRKYKAELESAQQQLAKTRMYSPIDGIVTAVDIEEGEVVTLNTATIITVIKEGVLEIEANVPEADIAKVSLGQNVEVTFDALSLKDVFKGKISFIYPASNVIQDVVFYKVKIQLDYVDPRLKPGMSCDADINTFEKNNVMIIPSRALKTNGGGSYVEILKENNVVERKNVEVGADGDDGLVEIKSGILEGDNVITFVKK
jgi:multidrug efflux pump subunit AcrA (membrane-fusion protein)